MIKMKALRSANMGAGGSHVKRGREFEVETDQRANELEAHGLAYRIETKAMQAPQNKMEPAPQNKAADAGPLDFPGGTTGEGTLALSSPQDHPRRRRGSRSSKDDSTS